LAIAFISARFAARSLSQSLRFNHAWLLGSS
jgi:hypothetical protein